MTPETLTIVGGLVTLALTVNAFFIKGLVNSLNELKTQTAVLIKESTTSENRLHSLEKEVFLIREHAHNLRSELGQRITLLEFKQNDK